MSPMQEVCADLRAYQVGRNVSYIGSFEAVFAAAFGPLQHHQHVKAYRNHLWITERQAAYRRADAGLRAWLTEQGVLA